MENETMNQNVPIQNVPAETVQPPVATPQSSSPAVWYIAGAAVIIALALGYLYMANQPSAEEQMTDTQATTGQEQTQAPASGNTTADISADLNQVDSSSSLDAEAAASADSVSGF